MTKTVENKRKLRSFCKNQKYRLILLTFHILCSMIKTNGKKITPT